MGLACLSLGHRMLMIDATRRQSQMGWDNWWKVPLSRRGSTYLTGRRGGNVFFWFFFLRAADIWVALMVRAGAGRHWPHLASPTGQVDTEAGLCQAVPTGKVPLLGDGGLDTQKKQTRAASLSHGLHRQHPVPQTSTEPTSGPWSSSRACAILLLCQNTQTLPRVLNLVSEILLQVVKKCIFQELNYLFSINDELSQSSPTY